MHLASRQFQIMLRVARMQRDVARRHGQHVLDQCTRKPEASVIAKDRTRSGHDLHPRRRCLAQPDHLQRLQRATLGGSPAWQVAVSAEADSLQITPLAGAVPASLSVETDRRAYLFILETGDGLQAAYLVRLQFGGGLASTLGQLDQAVDDIAGRGWTYRLRGDRSVRPAAIRDNGAKTVIEYAPDQALPAVFAIGPTGDEEVVDGYMRDGRFVIDRVHAELVFRIDKAKATAQRSARPETGQDVGG
jgi:type IV secretion system protein VirB9